MAALPGRAGGQAMYGRVVSSPIVESAMTQGPPSERTEVRRIAERGVYDHESIAAILDEALICHVGLVHDGHPVVIPTIHARAGSTLYIHGSPASRVLRAMKKGAEVCVTASIIDGLVLARSVFHHSMNYRSVVVYGAPRLVTDPEEKMLAFEAVTEHVAKGRWADARCPNDREIKATLILALPLDEASAKVRTGGPVDDDEDYDLPIWAGVVPVSAAYGRPIEDELMRVEADVPVYVSDYDRGDGGR
jgi:hypothetical protein